ncbi:MAG: TonB-dependent receptor [Sphingobium sp.]|nr:TonB-dependent receptor [Sphingobium sp.]
MSTSAEARALRRSILASASLIGLMASVPGFAQDTPAAEDEAAAIVVTGTRLQLSPGMSTPVPVTSVQADEIKSMAPNTLVEGLSQLPQFYGNGTSQGNNFFGSGSTGSLNLRGLGANRTLVLLNGRRMISATAFGGVDITNFPEALIRYIETVTGGASAAYGTDAVAGVTNFILNTNFEGIKASAQYGQTTRDDGTNYQVSVAAGFKIGDRGHFIVSAERFEQQGIHSYAGRDWYKAWGTIPDASGILNIYPNVVSINASYDGIISAAMTSPLYGYAFNRDGSASKFTLSSIGTQNLAGAANQIGGGGTARQSIMNGGSGDDLNAGEVNTIQPDFERSNIFAYADYEATDNLKFFAQYIRGRKTTSSFNTPRGSFTGQPTPITIFADNAFLPDNIKQIMTANNIPSFTFRRMGSIQDLSSNYKIWDETVLNSGTAGYEWNIANDGGLFDGWKVSGYYQYGESTRMAYQVGLRVDRIYAAMDAVKDSSGNIVCRVSLTAAGQAAFPGCKPLNLFGRGHASAQAVDYVIGYDPGQTITTPLFFANGGYTGETDSYVSQEAKVNIMKMKQHVIEGSITGELWKGWGAGPLSFAVGGGYRKETIHQVVRDPGNKPSDHTLTAARTAFPCQSAAAATAEGLRGQPAATAGDCANTVFIQFSKVSNIAGSISVKEAYGEMLVPILKDTPFFEELSVDLAGRWAQYTGSGDVWAYKGGLNWTVGAGLRLRGTYSRDVRAANLSERFDITGGAATVNDPQFKTASLPNGPSVSITRYSGGNPSVRPELAATYTAGAIYQPTFLPGFSVSLDWYQIKLKDAIAQVGTQNVVNNCYNGDTSYCALVTRDPSTQQLILVGDVFVNIAKSKVEGLDLEMSYRHNLKLLGGGDENISGRAFASWLLERSETGATGVTTNRAGQTGIQQSDGVGYSFPRFKLTSNLTYRNGGFSLFVQGRYISPGKNENNPTLTAAAAPQPGVSTIAHNRVPGVYYVDMRLGYTFELSGKDLEVFANITNLLDKSPPVTPYFAAFGNNSVQTNGGLFDTLGRRFVVGAKVKL